MTVREKIEAELRLSLQGHFRDDIDAQTLADRISLHADRLAAFAQPSSSPHPFLNNSAPASLRELQRVASAAIALADALNALHAPAIRALAEGNIIRAPWQSELAALVETATAATPEQSTFQTKPRDLRGDAFASTVAYTFNQLTGLTPRRGRNRGGFGALLSAVSPAVGMRYGSIDGAVRRACASWRNPTPLVGADSAIGDCCS